MERQSEEISRDSVNGRQLGYIIINTLIGSGVYVLPGLLAKGAGHDGWLLTLVITVIPIIYTLLICAFLKRAQMSFADAMKDGKGFLCADAYGFLCCCLKDHERAYRH